MKLLMIDNYDSFTFNLVQLFYEFDIEIAVCRHDEISLHEIELHQPDWICVSPGPKTPAHSGISKEVIRKFGWQVPILGVCLGMQVINEVFGGKTTKAPVPIHGKRSRVYHKNEGIFSGLLSPFWAARYHSLQINLNSSELLSLAHAEDGVIMGIQHCQYPICGVQFHPESFMSEYGLKLARNFLKLNQAYQSDEYVF
ncbi:anthranilate synthase component II [Candidatus Magnetomoraceae bacterium gMMP-15]